MDTENADACQRCVKSGRACVFTAVAKRKQRKRTDTRVAELEREMKAMRSMLKDKQQGTKPSGEPVALPVKPIGVWFEENSAEAPRREAYGEQARGGDEPKPTRNVHQSQHAPFILPPKPPVVETKDVVERGLISMATARQLFESYRVDLFPHYPMVYVSPSISAESMRETKPMLFLAILAAAAAKCSAELSAMLDKEVLQAYATRSLVRSEKSLELVQSLLLSSVWYNPPIRFGQLKYYEYIHMAAMMALDIGIGSRPTGQRARFGTTQDRRRQASKTSMHPLEDAMNPDLSMTPRSRDESPDTANVESRRTFLACYVIASAVAMSLRRPNMLRINSYIRECVEYLECSRGAVPTDRTVVAWVKLIIIQDEIGTSFAYDDPGGIASITELRVQLMLKDFEKRLTNWWTSTPEADMTGSLVITYYTARLYLYEVALHVDHSPEDFKAPYQMGVIEKWRGDEIPSQVLAEATAECITSAHRLLDTFLSMDPESLRAFPVFSFVRVSFAAFILAKLCLSAAHPKSRIGQVLDRNSIKAEEYLRRSINHVRDVVGSVRSRVPAIFLALLFKLRAWSLHPEMIEWSENENASPAVKPTVQTVMTKPSPRSAMADSAFEGPRIVEQDSSSESSPQTVHEHGVHSSVPGRTPLATARASESDLPGPTSHTAPAVNLAEPRANAPQHTFAASSFADKQYHQYPSNGVEMPHNTFPDVAIDGMDLDANFIDYLGDMNGLAEGGLTGLENWGPMPTELMAFDDTFGYQFAPNDNSMP